MKARPGRTLKPRSNGGDPAERAGRLVRRSGRVAPLVAERAVVEPDRLLVVRAVRSAHRARGQVARQRSSVAHRAAPLGNDWNGHVPGTVALVANGPHLLLLLLLLDLVAAARVRVGAELAARLVVLERRDVRHAAVSVLTPLRREGLALVAALGRTVHRHVSGALAVDGALVRPGVQRDRRRRRRYGGLVVGDGARVGGRARARHLDEPVALLLFGLLVVVALVVAGRVVHLVLARPVVALGRAVRVLVVAFSPRSLVVRRGRASQGRRRRRDGEQVAVGGLAAQVHRGLHESQRHLAVHLLLCDAVAVPVDEQEDRRRAGNLIQSSNLLSPHISVN